MAIIGAGGMAAYRAPMRSRDDDVPDGVGVERAIEIGVCGIGGRLDPPPNSWEEALTRTDALYGERVARRLERFATAPEEAFVWTRDAHAFLWLGRITGNWHYDSTREASEVDLVHVRSCDWLAEPISHADAPPSVQLAFARGGRNWQRIRPADAAPISAEVWEGRRSGRRGEASGAK